MTKYNIKTILDNLPHRYPFLLLDRVVSFNAEKSSIVGLKNVTINEPFFQGHFPGLPVMPGVLMIEALAQLSGVLALFVSGAKLNDENWFYFAGVDKARFKRVVEPGDQLLLHSEILRKKLDIWMFNTKVMVGEELACSAELMLIKRGVVR